MFTDVHSHVIWGVDDGGETEEETRKMLKDAAADGIDRIICTPHVTPGVYPFDWDVFLEHLGRAREFVYEERLGISLYMGAEILYTDSTPRLIREGKVPMLADSRCALIEFSPTDKWEHIADALQKTAGAGAVPVIAHMERYPAIGKVDQVRELKSRFRAMVQINARSLLRKQPLFRRGFFDRLFREGLVDFVATDTHAMPGRESCMRAGMEALKEKYGEKIYRKIKEGPEILFRS